MKQFYVYFEGSMSGPTEEEMYSKNRIFCRFLVQHRTLSFPIIVKDDHREHARIVVPRKNNDEMSVTKSYLT